MSSTYDPKKKYIVNPVKKISVTSMVGIRGPGEDVAAKMFGHGKDEAAQAKSGDAAMVAHVEAGRFIVKPKDEPKDEPKAAPKTTPIIGDKPKTGSKSK